MHPRPLAMPMNYVFEHIVLAKHMAHAPHRARIDNRATEAEKL